MTESRQFKRAKFVWLDHVKGVVTAHDLSPMGFMLAHELLDYFNEEQDGAAWPACRTLADGIGADKATVLRLLRRMVELGLLRAEWGEQGRGHSGRYWMVPKGASVHLKAGGKGAPAHLLKGAFDRQQKVQTPPEKVQKTKKRCTSAPNSILIPFLKRPLLGSQTLRHMAMI